MPRTAISGLVCTTFLVLLGFPAVPQEPAGKGADTESGQQTFNNACRTCHTIKEGDNRLGPNLHNVIGRKAGSLPNYGYSSAMKGADFVWDKEKLDRFIAKPDEVVPGNNMKPYGGLTSAEDRAKVIVFLESPTTNSAVTSQSRSLKRVAAPHNSARTASVISSWPPYAAPIVSSAFDRILRCLSPALTRCLIIVARTQQRLRSPRKLTCPSAS